MTHGTQPDPLPAAAPGRPYASERVVLLTRHGKERVLGPLLEAGLGARLEVFGGFDTDALGTFTRDVPRAGTQREAARRKARIAIDATGASLGLGSEGSFIPGPFGLGSWNVELVVLIDDLRGIEVVGAAHGPGLHVHGLARSRAELEEIAARAGFPEHGLVLRPDGPDDPRAERGIRTARGLEAAFDAARRASASGAAFVESDLRAHQHPTRMALVAKAGADLVARLSTPCPSCGVPGFGWSHSVPGLPCSACGTATEEPAADVHACVRCDRREERTREGAAAADPARCPWCNP